MDLSINRIKKELLQPTNRFIKIILDTIYSCIPIVNKNATNHSLKPKNIIELYDNVKIVSEDRILKGDELIIDLKNNTRTMSTSKKESVVEVFINE